MTSLILYAVEWSQSNIDCDVAQLRQIFTNTLELCKSNVDFGAAPLRQILTKCSKIKHVYEVLCAKQTAKIWCKNNIFTTTAH